MSYSEKLKDPRWQKKRLETLEADDFTCQYCGAKDKTLHVHHLIYPKSRNPWDAEDGDLITLCKDCHNIAHLPFLPLSAREIYDELTCVAMMHSDHARRLVMVINEKILKRG